MLISCIHGAAVGGARNRLISIIFNTCDVVTSQPEFVSLMSVNGKITIFEIWPKVK